MIRFLKALVLLPVAILVILLAVANRAPVTLSLDPFSQEAPEFSTQLPLFAVIFASVMLGVLIGGTASWMAQGKYRRGRRHARREARHLRDEAERLRAQAAACKTPALPAPQGSYP
ncbi:MAG TPA: lipopolysaccharide assembly protein LapA domain-containing protein [Microvirga sp.]|jgi:uncharacterized integral membrane protein|nr:lipopolysaccharide assembly protein LapA domain-containing protein [Microvirga sp.]